MSFYAVTVKIPKNPEHDPRNKREGWCPVDGGFCSDVTGEHHTLLVEAPNPSLARAALSQDIEHITRIELVVPLVYRNSEALDEALTHYQAEFGAFTEKEITEARVWLNGIEDEVAKRKTDV